jgi:aryl-alcohol dehydrogenase-like predicted oxidoreductase
MSPMPARTLGKDLEVSAVGLGCIGMNTNYGPSGSRDEVRELDDVTTAFAVHGGRGTGQEQYG